MHPTTKSKNAATNAKSSTCWERTAAPMLETACEKGIVQRKRDLQSLENAERTQTETGAKDWEETIEERSRPADFRHNQDYDLEDDKKTVDDGPEHATELIGHGAIPDQVD